MGDCGSRAQPDTAGVSRLRPRGGLWHLVCIWRSTQPWESADTVKLTYVLKFAVNFMHVAMWLLWQLYFTWMLSHSTFFITTPTENEIHTFSKECSQQFEFWMVSLMCRWMAVPWCSKSQRGNSALLGNLVLFRVLNIIPFCNNKTIINKLTLVNST